jgi:hypothetical protein
VELVKGLALAVVLAVVEAAPALADRRPAITYVAKKAPKTTDELPLPAVPTAGDVVELYRAVGKGLRELAKRDQDASHDLLARFRFIRLHDALLSPAKRRVAARTLVELRRLIAAHAN